MLVNMEGNSCFTSNGEVNEPGVNGWYGKGRAYAGIEGAVGVKGKIFGKEIDIKIIELVAAIMVDHQREHKDDDQCGSKMCASHYQSI